MSVSSPCVGASCCHKSTVKNVSGAAANCAFLPNHGKELAANEEVSYDGDIRAVILAKNKRLYDSFVAALDDGVIDLLHTPNPILYDHTLNEPKMLTVTNEAVVVADPCWIEAADSL